MQLRVKGSFVLNRNYDQYLLNNIFLISSRAYDRSMALQRLQQAGVVLTTTESIIFDLMRDAKHPKFKLVSGLIKAHKDLDATLPKFEI